MEPMSFHIDFNLHLTNRVALIVGFNITLAFFTFSDIELDIGYVLPFSHCVKIFTIQNRYKCAIAFYGETFEAVSPPNSTINVLIPFNVGEIGKVNFTYPVATNVTPPFYIQVIGEVVHPRPIIRDEDGNQISALLLDNGRRSATVFLENAGKTDLTIHNLDFTTSVFRLNSQCPGVLEPGEDCELHFSSNLNQLTRTPESYRWSFEVENVELRLELTVEITAEEMEWIKNTRAAKMVAVVAILCGSIAFPICRLLWKSCALARNHRKRTEALKRAIKRLSLSAFSSVGIEVIFPREKGVGTWVLLKDYKPAVTLEALAQMTALIS
jgi:hypothetical protein